MRSIQIDEIDARNKEAQAAKPTTHYSLLLTHHDYPAHRILNNNIKKPRIHRGFF